MFDGLHSNTISVYSKIKLTQLQLNLGIVNPIGTIKRRRLDSHWLTSPQEQTTDTC